MKKRGTFVEPKEKPPTFPPHLMFFWDAFWNLSTCRHEQGPIPWTAVNDYANRWRIFDPTDFDEFTFFIGGIDSAFMKYKSQKSEQKRNLESVSSKNRSRKKK